jgi:hypothetical protein
MVMTKKKYKSGKLTPMTEQILVNALKLWQQEFVSEIRKMEADGKRSMFHPNWTAVMMREFGIEFGIDELVNVEPIDD